MKQFKSSITTEELMVEVDYLIRKRNLENKTYPSLEKKFSNKEKILIFRLIVRLYKQIELWKDYKIYIEQKILEEGEDTNFETKLPHDIKDVLKTYVFAPTVKFSCRVKEVIYRKLLDLESYVLSLKQYLVI